MKMNVLRETSKLWGVTYKRYYFYNGERVSEAYATWLLKSHLWEGLEQRRVQGGWIKEWNIGPIDTAFYDRLDPVYI